MCGRCSSSYHGETEALTSYVGISPLALKKTKNSKDGLIRHHLLHLQCDNSSSSDEFNILAQDNENCLRVIKKVF